ncbi:MAG TPA: hypothetical protein VFQ77_06125 [Pseudonocardiaceae bacterium]|jgi:hypothetical protein|nr:hypothetical protein [Pseudonocardiaceae bacterium]
MPTVEQIRHGITTRPATLTSTADGRDHLVSDHAIAAGLAAGCGEHIALCGQRVVAAPLVAPPGPTCLDCETALHRISTASTPTRRRGLIARLLRQIGRPGSRPPLGGRHQAGGASHRARRA